MTLEQISDLAQRMGEFTEEIRSAGAPVNTGRLAPTGEARPVRRNGSPGRR